MSSLLAHAVRAFALALLVAVPARAEDPKPAPAASQAPSAVPARPASAFQAAKAFLDALDAFEKRQGGLGLTSLDAERKPPSKKRGEIVRLEIWLAITTPDPKTGRKSADDLVRTLKGDPAVSEAHLFDDYREPGPNGLAPERRLRLSITWDPIQAPERQRSDKPYERDDFETYIRMQAGRDKVEIGRIDLKLEMRPIAGTEWVDERWTILSGHPFSFQRLRIHNFAVVLEYDHPRATITRFRLRPPSGRTADDYPDGLFWEIELSTQRCARPGEIAPPPK